ncbi:hypothetical protein FOZ62_015509, partial [Perkinsus olseni]
MYSMPRRDCLAIQLEEADALRSAYDPEVGFMWLHRPGSPDDGDVAYAITIHGETNVEADATFMFTLPKGYPLELDVIPEVIAAEGSEAVCSKLKKLQELIVGNIWTQLKGGYEFPILAALAPVKGLLTKCGEAWEVEEEEREKRKAEAIERQKAEAHRAELMRKEAEKEYNAWADQMAAIQERKDELDKETARAKSGSKGKRGNKTPRAVDPTDWKEGEPITQMKSKFQAHLAFVETEEDVDIALSTLKRSHKILRAYNMYAYRFKTRESYGRDKSADLGYHQDHDSDGEGGAGTKLQELLTLTGAEGVLVVVSRWYGGIHMGPLRFKLINRVARQILEDEGVIDAGAHHLEEADALRSAYDPEVGFMWLHRPASPDDGDVAYAITIHGETDVEADATFMFTLPKGYPLELDAIPEVIAAEGSAAVCSKLKKLQELIVGNIWTQLKGGYEFPILAALAPVKGLLTKYGMAWEAEEEEKAKQEAEAREQKKASEREKALEREKAEAEQAEEMQEEAEKEYNAWASQMAAMQGRKEEFRKGNCKSSFKGKGRGTKAAKTADPSDLKEGEPITEKKSKFQAHLAFVESEEDVDIALNTLKQSHKILRATHNMYAYRFKMKEEGSGKDSKSADLGRMVVRTWFSDGEGGAGTKLQELLMLTGAEGVLVVVSRWYGGIHLGPLRFKLINRVARQILEDEGAIDPGAHHGGKNAVAVLGYMSMGYILTREGIPMIAEGYRLMTRPQETPEFIDPLPTEATLERWEKDRQLRGLDMTVASPDDVAKI